MVFLGIDWGEAHHDICLLNEQGDLLAKHRISTGLDGLRQLHASIAEHAEEAAEVIVGIETDHGLLVQALLAAGYVVYAINPLAGNRYRDRHVTSGAKSDSADARMLADLVRTDRHRHRPIAADSELVEAVGVLARAHKSLVWSRQRTVNQLRSALREFYPGALAAFQDLAGRDAIAILERAPTPQRGRSISQSKIISALRKAGRERNLEDTAIAIQAQLRAPQPEAKPLVSRAYGNSIGALVALLKEYNQQLAELEKELAASFKGHPDAEIYLSLPGLGLVLGARVMAEFGDDQTRFSNAKARKNYAGTSPITKASGQRQVVMARFARNDRLADACQLWAFASLSRSPGARHHYDDLRARGKDHQDALRRLANRWVGILHGCLKNRQPYREDVAWPHLQAAA